MGPDSGVGDTVSQAWQVADGLLDALLVPMSAKRTWPSPPGPKATRVVRTCVHAAHVACHRYVPRTCETAAMTIWLPDPHRRGATTARRSARTWLSFRAELVEGRGERFWP